MTSNYGWDANGMEREPYPAHDEHAAPRSPKLTAYLRAAEAHPSCHECKIGRGTTQPGPGHCRTHDRHCSAAPCW